MTEKPAGQPSLSAGQQSAVTAIFAFAGMGASFMQTILIPIQSRLPELLNASPSATAWVITITLLTSAITIPISGKLGDMFGKRLVALVLLGILIFSTALCALSSNIGLLIFGRGLQGAGMGVIPLGISILRDLVARERLGGSVAIVSATLGVGGAIGLPISALVTLHFEWHMLFVLASIISLVAFCLVYFFVPADKMRKGGKVDILGAIGLAILLTGFLLGISRGNVWGWGAWQTLTCFGIALIAAILWSRHELADKNPLVDLRLSARPAILMTNLASIAMGFALFASSIAFPQLLQLPQDAGGAGEDLLTSALMLMPSGIAMLFLSPISARLQKIWGPRLLLILGAAIIAVAYGICAISELPGWKISCINLMIGIGIGLGYAAMPSLIMRSVPQSETASANAVNTLMRSLGTTLAAAVVGAILAANVGSGASFGPIFMMGCAAAALCGILACFIPEHKA